MEHQSFIKSFQMHLNNFLKELKKQKYQINQSNIQFRLINQNKNKII